jgi:magnesium chelatase subunit I
MERPTSIGALRASGYRPRTVKEELRANLMRSLRAGEPPFRGIVGYERTVVPQIQNALLAGHDFILLGLRGQAKTRLLRSLSSLLDEAIPAVAGSPLREDPLRPVTAATRRRVEEEGDDLPIVWIPREERYREKLATPDVTIADLIGDIDPIKAATRKLGLDDPEVIHYGIVPRTNRGIFAINELPDLQARIQVGLLNILEEGDVQIRGFPIRLPLDLLLVFSANPEDYTNRGNIITPLRDRIASQILTHYPRTLEESRAITRQEAWTERDGEVRVHVPDWLETAIEEVAFQARASELVDQNSGVSARTTIALAESVVSNAERRALLTGARESVARVSDLFASIQAVTGKIELVYEGEREGVRNVALTLVGKAVRAVFDARLPGVAGPRELAERDETELEPIVRWFGSGNKLDVADDLSDDELFARLSAAPGLEEIARSRLAPDGKAQTAAAMELVLEGMHQHALLSKEELVGARVFRDPFEEVVRSFNT